MSSKSGKRPLCIVLTLFTLIVIALVVAIAVIATRHKDCPGADRPMSITSRTYGNTADGEKVTQYTLTNGVVTVKIIDYGGIITNIMAPDKTGAQDDIALGFDNMEGYQTNAPYFGAIIGRYANRIAGGHFTLDGITYNLTVNNVPNALHGGTKGFDKRLWASKVEGDRLVLSYTSADGEEHYPGEVTSQVTYSLTSKNELVIQYKATTTKATIINLTNHGYYNLAGQATNSIDDHVVRLAAEKYTPMDSTNIPLGPIENVANTTYDLTKDTLLGDRLLLVPGGIGFDSNFVFGQPGWEKHVARVTHPPSGRTLDMYSTEPGLQFYTAYYVNGTVGKGGVTYKRYAGFCLEAQHYPNSPNQPEYPSTVLRPDEVYEQTTKYIFGLLE